MSYTQTDPFIYVTEVFDFKVRNSEIISYSVVGEIYLKYLTP